MSPMDKKIDAAEKEVLVEVVRWTQKHGMKGAKGGWKEFLDSYDKRFGSSLSDPAKRPFDTLAAFLKTFTKDEDLKILEKVTLCHSNRKAVVQFCKSSPILESPQQRLVRLTFEHPEYPLNYSFPSHNEGWMVTKLGKSSKALKSNALVAIDCEMVLCEDGTEAVVEVCAVDHNLEVKLKELVNPNKAVADYRTEITGVSAKDLHGINCSLADVQKSLKKLLSHGTILVGHSLNNDLQALKLDHARVIDTSFIFRVLDGPRRPSLNDLCQSVLGYEHRKKGAPHNCLDDARAAMRLVLAKIEHGFDDAIILPRKDVSKTEPARLLLHRIPIRVPKEELLNIFPKEFKMELQNVNVRGQKYSVLAIFKDPQEASEAFGRVTGNEEQDSFGRPQKLVPFQLSTGLTASVYVRMCNDPPVSKMACDDPPVSKMACDDPPVSKMACDDPPVSKMACDDPPVSKMACDDPPVSKMACDDPPVSKMACDDPPYQSAFLEKKLAQVEELIAKSKKRKRDKVITEELTEPETNSDQCGNHVKEIERLKQELHQKNDEILNLQKILSALTRKHGL